MNNAHTSPFFSVVMPTYNRAHLLGRTIDSVLKQTFSDFELIVVDDGSKDNTEEVVLGITDHRVRYFKKENGERGAARNFGAQKATGAYINFFDSDDLMMSHHLQTAYDFICSKAQPEWLHLGYDYRDDEGNQLAVRASFDEKSTSTLLFDNILSCNGVIIRRDITTQFPFREERALASSEDWELWIRLLCRFRLHFVNQVTSTVVGHDLRSLNTIRTVATIERDEMLIAFLKQDPVVLKAYGWKYRRFIAERYSYFMLRYAEEKDYQNVLFWARKASSAYFPVIFSRRYLASLKNLVAR